MEQRTEVERRWQSQRREAVAPDAQRAERLGIGAAREHVRDRDSTRVLGPQHRGHEVDARAIERRLHGDVAIDEFTRDRVTEHLVDRGKHLLLIAGEEPGVHVGLGAAGDDVDLVARVEHGRVDRVAQGRTHERRDASELGERAWDVVGIEVHPGHVRDDREEVAHRRRDVHGQVESPESSDGVAQRRDRVVLVDHGPVPRATVCRQPQPADSLLGRLHQIETEVVAHGHREAADLTDRLGDAVEQVRPVLDQPVRADRSTRLFVWQEHDDDVAIRLYAVARPRAHRGQRHAAHVLHVHGATTPEHLHPEVLADLGAERRHRPVPCLRRHHVEVAVDQQRAPRTVASRDADDDTVTSRPAREPLGVEPHLAQTRLDPLGGLGFARPAPVAEVGGVDLDEF